jgi:EAL domain-containing protein (putative c-di-GMP-specific phosphodiesterase class I)
MIALSNDQDGPAIDRSMIRSILDRRTYRTVFQPIVELESRAIVGFEALTRFVDGTPTEMFAAAATTGLRSELEEATMRAAFEAAGSLPAAALLHLNVSADVILAHEPLATLLAQHGWLVVLELTEDVPVNDYPAFRTAMQRLGGDVLLAVDDAGAGFASLRHILELRPQFLKLDRSLVAGITRDPARQALVAGLSYFAIRTGAVLIAEAIESPGVVRTLLDLGVTLGQGFYPGRPVPAEELARAPSVPVDWPIREPLASEERPNPPMPETPIAQALNIGDSLARALGEVGVFTFGELQATGAVTAWRSLRALRPKLATPGALLALEASLQSVRPSRLSARDRGRLGVIARVEGRNASRPNRS